VIQVYFKGLDVMKRRLPRRSGAHRQ
jgi:hypothetical protein